jgi:hypothetical protein
MSDQNTLANLKLTTIELIEDFLLEKIKNIAPDILGTETILETDIDASNWRKEKIIDRLWKAKFTIMPPA